MIFSKQLDMRNIKNRLRFIKINLINRISLLINKNKTPKKKATLKDLRLHINTYERLILIKVVLYGNKIGYLNFTQYDGQSLKLADVYVFDGYRNLGVGTLLVQKAIEEAISLGVRRIYGVMLGDIDRLKVFYETFDFTITGTNIELNLSERRGDTG